MFGWGKRHGSRGRASDNNFRTQTNRAKRDGAPVYATPEVTEVIVYVPEPRPLAELFIIIAFTAGLVITVVAVLLGLSFHFGTKDPDKINVRHIYKYCDDDRDGRARGERDRSDRDYSRRDDDSDDRSEGRSEGDTGSSITIYAPCFSDSDEEGDYRSGSDSESSSDSNVIVLGRSKQ